MFHDERLTPYLARHHTSRFPRRTRALDADHLKILVDHEEAAFDGRRGYHLPLSSPSLENSLLDHSIDNSESTRFDDVALGKKGIIAAHNAPIRPP